MTMDSMITLFDKGTKYFDGNGDYVLNNIIFNDEITWGINDQWEFSFSAPVDNPLNIGFETEQYVRTPTPNFDNPQVFYIIHAERGLTTWEITAIHILNKLKNIYMDNTLIRDKSVVEAMNQIISYRGMELNFKVHVSSKNRNVDTHFERINALQAITDETMDNSIVTQAEAEFTANNLDLMLVDRIGKDRGNDIRYGRDLVRFAETVDSNEVIGRVVPVGMNGFTIPYEDGGPYIEYENYDAMIHKTDKMEYEVRARYGEDEDHKNALPIEEAVRQLKRLGEREFTLANIQEPLISYDIDIVDLTHELKGLQNLKPGDDIVIFDNKGNEIKERIIGYTYKPTTLKYTNLSLANKTPELTVIERAKKVYGGGTLTL